jgi:hypothetical protein
MGAATIRQSNSEVNMQPTDTSMRNERTAAVDSSPDGEDRVEDFLARHGGPSTPPQHCAGSEDDIRGWSEVYAADGYTLRCDWSQMGSRKEMTFSEIPSRSAAMATDKR